ncbi:putative carboxylesterase 18, partial [Cucurbita argyrosperma subsp. argyrosperma]
MADQALSPILLSLISPANSVNPLPKSSSTASSALHGRHCQIPLSPIENPPPCFLLLSLLRPRRARPNGTVNRCLLRLFDIKSAANPVKPIHGVVSFDVIVDSSRNLSIRVFTPSSNAISLPILIFFHGGGFSFLSNASFSYVTLYRCFARRIPAVVLSVNYRLSPEHRFPSQYDDGFDVLQFLDHENNTIGLLPPTADLSKCFLAGDSAGANLAHHVAVRFSRQKSQFQRANIIGLVSIQPFFGGQDRIETTLLRT